MENSRLKFRAWDKKQKRMFDVYQIQFSKTKKTVVRAMDFRGQVNLDDCEVMQFTGLLDKAKKEIYEGDVIEIYLPHNYDEFANEKFGRKIRAVIDFHGGSFWFTGEGQTDCNWHFYNASDREIIGNIYEHPELLEVK